MQAPAADAVEQLSRRWRAEPHVAWQIVNGQAVLVDLSSGKTVGLNPTGTLIWTSLAAMAPHQIAEHLAGNFGVDLDTAARDVAEFLQDLRSRGLVVQE